jgi:alpha-galactosidase
MVRFEIMLRFGFYNTESSVHTAEYHPYFIKSKYPEIVEKLGISLDEYLFRIRQKMDNWKVRKEQLAQDEQLTHRRSLEYASRIMEAVATDKPYKINGNVMNTGGLISNLPKEACVEVPCLIDANGVMPVHVGDLPAHLAALNQTNINMQLLTVQAAVTKKREDIYHAAYLDPHTAAELSLDDITRMCDELIAAHGNRLQNYK